MTDLSEEQARARRAYELSIGNGDDGFHGPIHPDELARLERALLSLPRRTRAIYRLDRALQDQERLPQRRRWRAFIPRWLR